MDLPEVVNLLSLGFLPSCRPSPPYSEAAIKMSNCGVEGSTDGDLESNEAALGFWSILSVAHRMWNREHGTGNREEREDTEIFGLPEATPQMCGYPPPQ
ncbi:MAG: hypothetical protein V3T83_02085 [Acidobacteriota bacterium]